MNLITTHCNYKNTDIYVRNFLLNLKYNLEKRIKIYLSYFINMHNILVWLIIGFFCMGVKD